MNAKVAPAARLHAAPPAPLAEVDHTFLKRLLWLYLALWITEGALRKWVLPGLAAPLLVVRDPFLLLIYYRVYTERLFPRDKFVWMICALGLTAFLVSLATTTIPTLGVQLYGLRASYLHLPLIFVIPKVFDADDVRRVGRWTLLCAGPMALLVLAQFLAGSRSALNVGAGGTVGAMIESAYGHIRPSGTFSFTNGLSGFTAVVAVFFLYHLLEKNIYPRLLWLAAAPALVILIVLSGSRAGAGLVALILGSVLFIGLVQRRYLPAVLKLCALVGAVCVVVGSLAVFQQGLEVFAYRFGDASNVRTGFIGRFFESFLVPFQVAETAPTFGYGLGMGTNVAGGLLYGHSAFLLAEGELARNILESGPFVGGLYLCLRAALALSLGLRAWTSLWRGANILPMMLFSICCVDLLQGQFSQPTGLGFATIAAGLCLAANRRGASAPEPARAVAPVAARPMRVPGPPAPVLAVPVPAPVTPAVPAMAKPVAVRGQSAYAARLHAATSAPLSPENPENPGN